MKKLLSVKNLSVRFRTAAGLLEAVNGVSFEIAPRTTLGLVGESGCGKTVTCLSILKLIEPPGEITGGEVLFENKNLLGMKDEELRSIRGNKISFVFQEPMTCLNPVLTIGEQIAEAILAHRKVIPAARSKTRGFLWRGVKKKEAMSLAVELLEKVKMPFAQKIIYQYPHQLSGGMCQRVMIAAALSCNPKLLIADEPTTALDVTVQKQILELLQSLREEFHMSVLLVTHDFGIVAKMADFVAVMYAGEIVEYAKTGRILKNPQHPYTIGLLAALPQPASRGSKFKRLKEIPGSLPDLTKQIKGCLFYPRCSEKKAQCLEQKIALREVAQGHYVRCVKW